MGMADAFNPPLYTAAPPIISHKGNYFVLKNHNLFALSGSKFIMNTIKFARTIRVNVISSDIFFKCSKLKLSQIHPVVFGPYDKKHFGSCNVLQARRLGKGAHEGKMEYNEIVKIVDNEKRGIFRTLDIGLPRPFNQERKKWNDRILVKAAPRYVHDAGRD